MSGQTAGVASRRAVVETLLDSVAAQRGGRTTVEPEVRAATVGAVAAGHAAGIPVAEVARRLGVTRPTVYAMQTEAGISRGRTDDATVAEHGQAVERAAQAVRDAETALEKARAVLTFELVAGAAVGMTHAELAARADMGERTVRTWLAR